MGFKQRKGSENFCWYHFYIYKKEVEEVQPIIGCKKNGLFLVVCVCTIVMKLKDN